MWFQLTEPARHSPTNFFSILKNKIKKEELMKMSFYN